jgi:NNP family nitrate/nitrite transporter-like MFS transporter
VVFGGYVALALWMTKYYVSEYGFDMKLAALLAACFSLPGGVLRALGGWISDKYGAYKVTWSVMWVCWVAFFLLSYPQTSMVVKTVTGDMTLHIGLNPLMFTVILFVVGVAMAVGKASVFKFISDDFQHNIGAVSGVVGLAGGLGGFILPIMFGALVDLTGIRSSSFMLMYGTVCVSLVWMHFSFKPQRGEPEAVVPPLAKAA